MDPFLPDSDRGESNFELIADLLVPPHDDDEDNQTNAFYKNIADQDGMTSGPEYATQSLATSPSLIQAIALLVDQGLDSVAERLPPPTDQGLSL